MVTTEHVAGEADSKRQEVARYLAGAQPMSDRCKSYAVDLSAYFDRELDVPSTERIEAHLSDCSGCRDTLQRLGKLRSALHAMSRPGRKQRSILNDLKARMQAEDAEDADASSDDGLPS